jgi:peptidoglycan hydrolase-like protein with peptidoglycan-binding domain
MPGQQGTIPEVVGRPESTVGEHRSATASREDVRKAQEALKAQGHNVGSFDGNMDNRTQQALRDFQQANKLPVTGTLDQQTAAKLGIRLNSGTATPKRGQDSVTPQGSEAIPGKRPVQ